MQLRVCGAAREVTGSCYLLDVGRTRFLVDCGLHQGGEREEAANYMPFAFDPAEVDFLLLTHAHIDHSGLIPRLAKQGFTGSVFSTGPTRDLAEIMLMDSAHIQETESEWRTRKARRAGRAGRNPLYTAEDARESLRLFQGVEYSKIVSPSPETKVRFNDAGHILGSATLEIWLTEQGRETKVVFSGDLGQPDRPLVRDPEFLTDTDFLVLESTYGDRVHEVPDDPISHLAAILKEAKSGGGNVIIPSFAVGRTQEVIYYLKQLFEREGFDMPVYVDSPLATEATEVYWRNRAAFDEEAARLIAEEGALFEFPQLHYTHSADESRELNDMRGIIIISSSGMAEAGRIKHHLKHNLWKPEAHVVIVGYQVPGTLGRRLLDGEKRVRIFGEEIAVRAKIHEMTYLSAHADRNQILNWVSHFKPPYLTLLTHGDAQAAFSLEKALEERLGFRVVVPERCETFNLGMRAPK